ncbi:MAG: hypothetical protein DMG78_26555 [Acidobacteria bacterium]|nr:MAG: hypothetical protein DMG78_26555 [Acidobacteriota bacterium]
MLIMKWLWPVAAWIAGSLLTAGSSSAQQACPQPPALERVAGKTIFTDQQEIDLGDAMGDSLAREFVLIDDPVLTAHLEALGARLARYLPPNNLRFRFFLIDLPEVNAFSLSGGRIYVARKMVALTRSEDELAGVLAHEMGHIVTHQHSILMTHLLKRVLGVTQVGDRASGAVCHGTRRICAAGLCRLVGSLQRHSRKNWKLVYRSARAYHVGAEASAGIIAIGFADAGRVRKDYAVIDRGVRGVAIAGDRLEHWDAYGVASWPAGEAETGAAAASGCQQSALQSRREVRAGAGRGWHSRALARSVPVAVLYRSSGCG